MEYDRQKCIDAGCNDYTTKPINHKKLIELVSQYASLQDLHTTVDAPVAQ